MPILNKLMNPTYTFWKQNTNIKKGSLIGLLITGAFQVLIVHVLIEQKISSEIGLLARGIVFIIIPFFASVFSSQMASFATIKIQNKLIENLSHATTNKIEQIHSEDFSKSLLTDADRLYQFWRESFTSIFFNLPVLLYLEILVFIHSNFLFLLGANFTLFFLVWIAYLMNSNVNEKYKTHNHEVIQLLKKVRNYIENIFQFRIYQTERKYITELKNDLDKCNSLSVSINQSKQFYGTYVSGILLLLLWLSLWLTKRNTSISTSEAAVIMLIFLEVRRIANEIFFNVASFHRADESAKKLEKWLTPDQSRVDEIQNQSKFETILLNNLEFRYNENKRPIKYPDLEINIGEKIWLKGKNGRGKSTLWKIMTGLYTDTKSFVWINGTEEKLNGIQPRWKNIAVVTEPVRCYDGKIWEIIGKFTSTREEVLNWLTEKNLIKIFETYPEKIDTAYDSAIKNLSSGQLKWLIIVQAFYQNPAFLILDEPFSSLDTERQHLTLELINQLPQTVTLIVVTHHEIGITFDKVINL